MTRRDRRFRRLYAALRLWVYLGLASLTCWLCLLISPGWTVDSGSDRAAPIPALEVAPSPAPMEMSGSDHPLDRSRSLYEQGRYGEAATQLEAAVQSYQAQGDRLQQAIALSNLALVYHQVGHWPQANAAIEQSLRILESSELGNQAAVLAQALDVQGRLWLAQGQAETALEVWQRSESLYQDLALPLEATQSRINQAEALQSLGLYRRAVESLESVVEVLQAEPPSLVKVVALRSLGDALRVSGEFHQAQTVLEEGLALAQSLNLSQSQQDQAIAATQLSLGNLFYAQGKPEEAIATYQAIATGSPLTQAQAKLNLFRVWVSDQQWDSATALIPDLSNRLDRLPLSHASIYAQVNFAQSLLLLDHASVGTALRPQIAHRLTTAVQQAKTIQDRRAESFAVGGLGTLYEQTQQWAVAQTLTEQALALAQQINASDVAYLWQWQLGRVLNATGDRPAAIAAYDGAVSTLRSLRSDLVAINPDVQFSFRDSIEPIHRQLVSLLLAPGIDPTQAELEQARKTIESLQLAELDNFFREACLNAQEVQIDEVDRRAAVIYPIILEDRLETIISLPAAGDKSERLQHYATPLPRQEVEQTVNLLRNFLEQYSANRRAMPLAQEIYGWLIRPIEEELAQRQVRTLVFILDGVFRNLPMAVLHDGQQYLIQTYSLAMTPSLQLLESQPLEPQRISVLMGGLSESRQNFPALPNVELEFETIQAEVRNRILFNQQFTSTTLQEAINDLPFPVVHLATHGQFSSRLDDTFILTWDGRINVNQLSAILQTSDLGWRRPIELLVLSACQTASGDNRAALGLAGVAVRAGARSTLATLWSVNDEAMAVLMGRFYEELTDPGMTKAEALRRAQLSLLDDPNYQRPFFWSPVVLVGNWL